LASTRWTRCWQKLTGINSDIKEILDVQTADWGLLVTLVELKDIQLPDAMRRAMARQAEAERKKRGKIIAAEGESLAAGLQAKSAVRVPTGDAEAGA
jgi:regulator of protease activity HflC (stomatin/prohibitin superfamily)